MGKLAIRGLDGTLNITHEGASKNLETQDFKYIRDTIKDIPSIPTLAVGDVLFLKGYHEVGDQGGGLFIWDPNESKANHNGGTVIDPSKQFPSDWSDETLKDSWFNTTNEGTGCWKRVFEGVANVSWFGAVGDGEADDYTVIKKVLSSFTNKIIKFNKGNYLYGSDFDLELNNIHILGEEGTVLLSKDKVDSNGNPDIYVFRLTGSNIKIENIKITRNTYVFFSNLPNSSWLLRMTQVKNFELKNIEITGSINWSIALLGCEDGIVHQCNIHDTGKDGIHLIGGKNIIIKNNKFENILDDKIALEDNQDFPQYGQLHNIIVDSNIIENYPVGRGVYCVGGHEISITNNKVNTNFDSSCVQYFSDTSLDPNSLSSEAVFLGQRYETTYGQSYLQSNITIKGNHFISNESDIRAGIHCMAGINGAIISDNVFNGKATSIVFANDAHNPSLVKNIQFTNNIIKNVKNGIASNDDSLESITIDNNRFFNVREHGIFLNVANSADNTFFAKVKISNNYIEYESTPISYARGIYVNQNSHSIITNNYLKVITTDTTGNLREEIRIDNNKGGTYIEDNNIRKLFSLTNSNAVDVNKKNKDKTFYVDGVNGSDSNDGSSNNPFKTLEKAIGLAGNGFTTINLLSDVDFTNIITVFNKKITVNLQGHAINVKTNGSTSLLMGIKPVGSSFEFNGNNASGSKIVLPDVDSDTTDQDNYPAFFKANTSGSIIKDLSLSYNVEVEVQNTQYKLLEVNDKSYAGFGFDGSVTDNSNNNQTINSLITGIVKDSNGIPRNIISNIVF